MSTKPIIIPSLIKLYSFVMTRNHKLCMKDQELHGIRLINEEGILFDFCDRLYTLDQVQILSVTQVVYHSCFETYRKEHAYGRLRLKIGISETWNY